MFILVIQIVYTSLFFSDNFHKKLHLPSEWVSFYWSQLAWVAQIAVEWLSFLSHDWRLDAVFCHVGRPAHTWQPSSGSESWSAVWSAGPGLHCSSSSHSQTLPPESPGLQSTQKTKHFISHIINKSSLVFQVQAQINILSEVLNNLK